MNNWRDVAPSSGAATAKPAALSGRAAPVSQSQLMPDAANLPPPSMPRQANDKLSLPALPVVVETMHDTAQDDEETLGLLPPAAAPAPSVGRPAKKFVRVSRVWRGSIVDDDASAASQKPKYKIVDLEDDSNAKTGADPIPQSMVGDPEAYWRYVSQDVPKLTPPAKEKKPVLIIMYGPMGSGKSRVLREYMMDHGWDHGYFVHLDPDELRMYSKEFRLCISGAHAAKLISVQREFGSRLTPTKWRHTMHGRDWEEDGCTVEENGVHVHLALALAPLRSQPIVRRSMLWGFNQPEIGTASFVDRAFTAGYNVIYDTIGNEPNRFLRELMRRARECHDYKVVVIGSFAPVETCKQRYAHRATVEGRHVSDDYADKVHKMIFPQNVCDSTHFDKFEEEMEVGDERNLYDNSAKTPVLKKRVVTDVKKVKSEKVRVKSPAVSARGMNKERVKQLVKNIEIYTDEMNDLKQTLGTLGKTDVEADEEEEGGARDDASKKPSGLKDERESVEERIQSHKSDIREWMGELERDASPEWLVQYVMVMAIERLASSDLKVRRIAKLIVEKMKPCKVASLPEDMYEEIVSKWIHLPQMLFNNLASSQNLTSHQRRRLCRIPAVQATLVQDMPSVRWLLNRMSQEPSKAESAVEYFERVTELRQVMGLEGKDVHQMNRFYRGLGRRLALQPRASEGARASSTMVIRLFPTLYAMTTHHRVRVIDCCVGTPLLAHPLNILIGQPLALGILILDGLVVIGLLWSTFKLRLDELDCAAHLANVTSLLEQPLSSATPLDGAGLASDPLDEAMAAASYDSRILLCFSLYACARELVSMWSFHLVAIRAGHQATNLSVFTYFRNKWKWLNILSALSTLFYALGSSGVQTEEYDDARQRLVAAWTVGLLWLRSLGYIQVLSINFATYVTCLGNILADISYFLVIMLIVVLMFGSMLFIHSVPIEYHDVAMRPSWEPEIAKLLKIDFSSVGLDDFDLHPFHSASETLLTMWRSLLGETHRYWFQEELQLALYFVYSLVLQILMLNVLIAVISDSYEYSIIRARTIFLETRVELIVEMQSLGLTTPYRDSNTTGAWLFGGINESLREANRWLWCKPSSLFGTPTGGGQDAPQLAAPAKPTAASPRGRRASKAGLRKFSDGEDAVDATGADAEEEEEGLELVQLGGVLGALQKLMEIEDDSAAEGAADSWLGRALDMERRTQKIVGMAELNLEDSLQSKVEQILEKQRRMEEQIAEMHEGMQPQPALPSREPTRDKLVRDVTRAVTRTDAREVTRTDAREVTRTDAREVTRTDTRASEDSSRRSGFSA